MRLQWHDLPQDYRGCPCTSHLEGLRPVSSGMLADRYCHHGHLVNAKNPRKSPTSSVVLFARVPVGAPSASAPWHPLPAGAGVNRSLRRPDPLVHMFLSRSGPRPGMRTGLL